MAFIHFLLSLTAVLAGSSGDGADPGETTSTPIETTSAPTTQPPTTQAPTTKDPTTQDPTTQDPTTKDPTPAPTCNDVIPDGDMEKDMKTSYCLKQVTTLPSDPNVKNICAYDTTNDICVEIKCTHNLLEPVCDLIKEWELLCLTQDLWLTSDLSGEVCPTIIGDHGNEFCAKNEHFKSGQFTSNTEGFCSGTRTNLCPLKMSSLGCENIPVTPDEDYECWDYFEIDINDGLNHGLKVKNCSNEQKSSNEQDFCSDGSLCEPRTCNTDMEVVPDCETVTNPSYEQCHKSIVQYTKNVTEFNLMTVCSYDEHTKRCIDAFNPEVCQKPYYKYDFV